MSDVLFFFCFPFDPIISYSITFLKGLSVFFFKTFFLPLEVDESSGVRIHVSFFRSFFGGFSFCQLLVLRFFK